MRGDDETEEMFHSLDKERSAQCCTAATVRITYVCDFNNC